MTNPASPDFSQGNYIPEQFDLPEDPKEVSQKIKETFEDFARNLNRKDTGQYETVEVQINQTWPGTTPQTKNYIYRKVINTGALPNAGLKSVAHGITGINNNWFFTRVYGSAQEPAGAAPRPIYIPLPNTGATYPIEVWVDITNVNLNTAVNLSAFTSSYIVLEFYKG